MNMVASPLRRDSADRFRTSPEINRFDNYSDEMLMRELMTKVCALKAIRHTIDLACKGQSLHQQCIMASAYCGVGKDTVYSWYMGNTKPRLLDILPLGFLAFRKKTLEEIAAYLIEVAS